MNELAVIIASTLNAGTALALAALGLLVNERSGIVNLGAEGMMLVAAVAGFATGVETGSDTLAFLAGAGAGAVMALAFGVMVIWLNTNQYATGLALSLFGAGFSAFVGVRYTQQKLTERPTFKVPGLGDLPFFGAAIFRMHPLEYLAIALAVGLGWFLYRSRSGMVLRAIGESPESAHALGYPVRRIRLLAVTFGGVMCGLAGAYLSVVYTPLWVEGMVAGRGWIALALTTFATWRPARAPRRVPLRRRHHVAAAPPGRGRRDRQPVAHDVAVSGDDPRPRPDVSQARLRPDQHARVARQTLLPGLLTEKTP